MENQENHKKPQPDQLEKIVKDPFQPQGPRDGLDNTGTQGADSLKDDGYTGGKDENTDGDKYDGTATVRTP